jgi:demethylmenaquinone methyltransferase/2-methoxy-6-polyprenyl-1,4-benzoquinol methylase
MTQTNATKIIGLDISAGMLEVGVKKLPKRNCLIQLRWYYSENMPLMIIILTILLSVSNFETLDKGLKNSKGLKANVFCNSRNIST